MKDDKEFEEGSIYKVGRRPGWFLIFAIVISWSLAYLLATGVSHVFSM